MLGSDLLHRNKAGRAYRMFSVKTSVQLNFSWTAGTNPAARDAHRCSLVPACSLPLVHNSHTNKM